MADEEKEDEKAPPPEASEKELAKRQSLGAALMAAGARMRQGAKSRVSMGPIEMAPPPQRPAYEVQVGPAQLEPSRVSLGQIQMAQQSPGMDVRMGPVQMGPASQAQASEPAAQPPQQQGGISTRREQLMSEGLTAEQSMQQMVKEGLVDPRLAEMMMRVPRAVGKTGV